MVWRRKFCLIAEAWKAEGKNKHWFLDCLNLFVFQFLLHDLVQLPDVNWVLNCNSCEFDFQLLNKLTENLQVGGDCRWIHIYLLWDINCQFSGIYLCDIVFNNLGQPKLEWRSGSEVYGGSFLGSGDKFCCVRVPDVSCKSEQHG